MKYHKNNNFYFSRRFSNSNTITPIQTEEPLVKPETIVPKKAIKLAVVGASGVVGTTVLKVLEKKNLPIDEYVFFSSKKSAGKTLDFMGQVYEIRELTEDSLKDNFNYAIFCAGSEVSKKYAPIAVDNGCIVIDNSSYYRMNQNVPLVVPEVNPEDINYHNGIIANPNCSTIQAVVALKPLHEKYKIKRIVYSTYQAVSGAGSKGIYDFENGILNYMDNKDISESYYLQKFPHPIFSNCIPQIDVFTANGFNTKEEEKMINETRKILHDDTIRICATCVRVPVLNSHSEAINIEFSNNFDITDLIHTLENSPGVVVQDVPEDSIYPMAIHATKHDRVFVGRIRRDTSVTSGINMWVVADNLRKGAATNAVQILELLLTK